MSGEYALQLLKSDLRDKQTEVKDLERPDNLFAKTITKMRHQIYDLKFAIELLEEYQD